VLNIAINQAAGLVTFNGPAVMTDFADQPHMDAYTERWMHRVLCHAEPAGLIEPAAAWTEEFWIGIRKWIYSAPGKCSHPAVGRG
jgi:muramoyltetrapeptide carboxypeptidase LdcA involved in peptidoglycan recycling